MAIIGGNRRRRRATSSAADPQLLMPSHVAAASASISTSPYPPDPASTSAAASADSSIARIKRAYTSHLDSLRKEADLMHASLLKEVSSASGRVSKRIKLEVKSCSQHMDEFERDCNAFSVGYKEEMDDIKGDHEEFVSRVQSSTSQYLNKILPEFMENVNKDIGKLRARFASPA